PDVGADEYNGLTGSKNEEKMMMNILAYPNPFENEIVIEMEKNYAGHALLVIYDLLGRSVWTSKREIPSGKWVERINSENMQISGGTYLLCVFTGDERRTFVLTKR
ncbi:MAG TPA: T9SS type A sorting domain-containing protein, partial [Bacteroidia bacterium]